MHDPRSLVFQGSKRRRRLTMLFLVSLFASVAAFPSQAHHFGVRHPRCEAPLYVVSGIAGSRCKADFRVPVYAPERDECIDVQFGGCADYMTFGDYASCEDLCVGKVRLFPDWFTGLWYRAFPKPR